MKSDTLSELLDLHFPEIKIIKICSTVSEGVKQINALQPDLIFLDVQLDHPNTGFDLLEQTSSVKYGVIFTTSYDQYAVRAFRFAAIDYIQGLYGYKELKIAIDRYKSRTQQSSENSIGTLLHNEKHSSNVSLQKVGIPVLGGYDFIMVSEIIYCKSVNTSTEFFFLEFKKETVTKTLKWVEELLMKHNFFRIHDSYLINLVHVVKYRKRALAHKEIEGSEGNEGGDGGYVELTNEMEVPVSRRKKEEFLKILSNRK